MQSHVFADHALSRRLELAEGRANAGFIESRARIDPSGQAEWIEVGGALAMFDTPDSPITQTFGLGMSGEVTAADFDRLEAFFRGHGAPADHEISPLADPSVWPLIAARRYEPIEFTSVLYCHPGDVEQGELPADIDVRIARPEERELWARLATEAWASDHPEMTAILAPLMGTVFDSGGVVPFLGLKAGQPIATASLNIQGDVALLAGASTIPAGRRQGAQRALLAARLEQAVKFGCSIATMGAQPGGASQRNAERSGFRIAYTRTKWRLGR